MAHADAEAPAALFAWNETQAASAGRHAAPDHVVAWVGAGRSRALKQLDEGVFSGTVRVPPMGSTGARMKIKQPSRAFIIQALAVICITVLFVAWWKQRTDLARIDGTMDGCKSRARGSGRT